MATNFSFPKSSAQISTENDIFARCFEILMESVEEIIDNWSAWEIGDCGTENKKEFQNWVNLVLTYNVPNGKKIRGQMVVLAFEKLVPNPSPEKLFEACILGWCVEMLQAAFLVADDIMDHGITRRGQPCWYLKFKLGNDAVNDSFLLEQLVYQVVKKYFKYSPIYVDLLELFHDVTLKTVTGQSFDLAASRVKTLDTFSLEMCNSISTFKTAYYTVYLPIALAMNLAGICTSGSDVENVALKIGIYFQIYDDFMDNFVEDSVMKKKGSDIQERKCTWLFAMSKLLCSSEKFNSLQTHYGKNTEYDVNRVKKIYKEIGLEEQFAKHRLRMNKEILESIQQIKDVGLRQILKTVWQWIFQRQY